MNGRKHYWDLFDSPFNSIKNGKKDIEVRLFDKKRQIVTVGDKIIFNLLSNPEDIISVGVSKIEVYDTFEELFEKYSPIRFGMNEELDPNELAIGMTKYYPLELQKKFKKVGFHLVR